MSTPIDRRYISCYSLVYSIVIPRLLPNGAVPRGREVAMASTVVRIDERTHATLRALAEREHKSIGQIVTELVDRQETERFWREMREGYARLQADPVAWQDYLREAQFLEEASMDGLEQEEPYYSPEEEAEIEQYARSQGW